MFKHKLAYFLEISVVFSIFVVAPCYASESFTSKTSDTAPSFWTLDLGIAQTPGFWGVIEELQRKSHTLPEIDALLQDQFNQPDEGLARFKFRYYASAREGGLGRVASHGYVGVRGDLLVGGVAKNRIFPSVHGYKAMTAQLEFGLAENPRLVESNWSYQLGSVVGLGSQELIDGFAIDLYPKPPIEKSSLFFWGLDFHLRYEGIFNETLRADNQIFFQPTFFHADATNSPYTYQIRRNDITWRWRTESEWWIALTPPSNPILELSFFGIAGQQPVPVPILPRIWDAVHQLDPLPSTGQLLGLGSGLGLRSDDFRYGISLKGGFFGGYLGATALLKLKWFELGAGTVGVEQTSGYRVTESRLKYAWAGVRYEF